jgi:histidinol-phosphatase
VIEAQLKPYDIQALIPIIEAAGGVVTNWSGQPAYEGGQVIAAGDPRLHQAAINMLADARD